MVDVLEIPREYWKCVPCPSITVSAPFFVGCHLFEVSDCKMLLIVVNFFSVSPSLHHLRNFAPPTLPPPSCAAWSCTFPVPLYPGFPLHCPTLLKYVFSQNIFQFLFLSICRWTPVFIGVVSVPVFVVNTCYFNWVLCWSFYKKGSSEVFPCAAGSLVLVVWWMDGCCCCSYWVSTNNLKHAHMVQCSWLPVLDWPLGNSKLAATHVGEQGRCSGESTAPSTNVARVRLPVPVICGLSLFLVLVFAPQGFSLGTLVFPSPQKPTFPNSYLIRNPRATGFSVPDC